MNRLSRAMSRFVLHFTLITIAAIAVEARAQDCTGPGAGAQPFFFLQSGFSQQLFATDPTSYTAIGFAPNGDLWWGLGPNIFFPTTPSTLARFSSTSTAQVHATTVHVLEPGSPFASTVGTGMTNGFSGNLYSNTMLGIVMLDPNTGSLLAGPFGPAGSGLGIATDPQTGNLVYVGADGGTLFFVDPALTASGIFATATSGRDLDGIYFDPTGNFLFAALSLPEAGLGVVNRQGNLLQVIPNPGGGVPGSFCDGPDGVAFHRAPDFVVSTNRNGTMTRYDFPNGFAQPPVVSIFASGGFRGDFTQVGSDSCLYVSQDGTRFNDTTVSLDRSVVHICPNFVAPPGINPAPGRMTGDGRLFTSGGTLVEDEFQLHCNPKNGPNNLYVNWGPGNSFHQNTLTAAVCFMDTTIAGSRSEARFNTIIGTGSGTYNHAPGATVRFTFNDAGERGTNDSASIVITDANGNVVLSVSGNLAQGDQEAHAR